MSSYHLRGDILTNSTLVKEFERNEHGYSKVPLGEFNSFNRMGDFYPARDAVPQLLGNSRLYTTLMDGSLYGEVCHPPYSDFVKPGVSERDALAQWLHRLSLVDAKLISHHISEIFIDVDGNGDYNDEKNKVRVWAWVRPFGPYASMVEDSFKVPTINSYFSLRSVVKPEPLPSGTGRRMNMFEIYTYDFVTRGGYGSACKWKAAPGLEHHQDPSILDARFKIEDMVRARNFARTISTGREAENMIGEMDRCIDRMRERTIKAETRFSAGRSYGLWD